jgi:hypothetical protein
LVLFVIEGIAFLFAAQLDEAEAVSVIAHGQIQVVCDDEHGVEDDPAEHRHQDEFGHQPTVSAAAGPYILYD